VRGWARARKISIEAAAREARFEAFAAVARELGIRRVVLGHHADDQVETFLFNLLRGAGPGGFGAMAAVSPRKIDDVELELVRPFLPIWREEIDRYAAAHGLMFCDDPSNASPLHTRNRLRHQVVPMLCEAMERDIRPALWRAAELLRDEDACLSPQTPEPGDELSVAVLRLLAPALQRRLVRRWLLRHGVPDVGFENVEAVRALPGARAAKVNLPGGWYARRRAGRIFLQGSPSGC
jgi:tRNA(Ile)-lysidine synthase